MVLGMRFGPEQLLELGVLLRPDLCVGCRDAQLKTEIAYVTVLALGDLLA